MKWIKIEEGCEMPIVYESVAASRGDSWFESYIDSNGQWQRDGCEDMKITGITHWARVELPEE